MGWGRRGREGGGLDLVEAAGGVGRGVGGLGELLSLFIASFLFMCFLQFSTQAVGFLEQIEVQKERESL